MGIRVSPNPYLGSSFAIRNLFSIEALTEEHSQPGISKAGFGRRERKMWFWRSYGRCWLWFSWKHSFMKFMKYRLWYHPTKTVCLQWRWVFKVRDYIQKTTWQMQLLMQWLARSTSPRWKRVSIWLQSEHGGRVLSALGFLGIFSCKLPVKKLSLQLII